ncbi:hypothetical protein LJC46_04715, partial [Desulfovibrio sp. OttesenSCG-928-G15]|nr:hypothetical protein [Desulfovibrio sp. OttesenSCG-928-G15]
MDKKRDTPGHGKAAVSRPAALRAAKWWLPALLSALLLLCPPAVKAENDDPFAKLREAAIATQENALFPPAPAVAAANAVRGYLAAIDQYSSYITAEQYASLFDAPAQYAGVGMDILQGPGGVLHCLPYTGGPADVAGILAGDILYAVNKTPTSSLPILVVERMIRGEPGSKILMGIAS